MLTGQKKNRMCALKKNKKIAYKCQTTFKNKNKKQKKTAEIGHLFCENGS